MSPERRRDQLVRTALELFATRPPELVTPEDVAQAAGVSRALFYRYFANVHELRVAALRTVVEEVIVAVTPPAGGTLLDQVRHALSAFLGEARQYAGAYVALLRTGSVLATPETEQLVDSVREHLIGLVAARVGQRPAPMFELTLRCWFAVVEGASVRWLRDGGERGEWLEAWLIDQLMAMTQTTAGHDPATAAQLRIALR
jgi:AcrR family transcriptional regulator